MANLTITIPDAEEARVNNALSRHWSYETEIPAGTPNPESKRQFVKRRVVAWFKSQIIASESEDAARAARKTAEDSAKQIAIS